MYPQGRGTRGTLTSWMGVLICAILGAWLWSHRGAEEPAAEPRATVVVWDGVWKRGTAILRIRQRGAGLQGEFCPDGVVCRLTGKSFAEDGMFSTTIDGRAWRFRMTQDERGIRLVGWCDPTSVLETPGGRAAMAKRTIRLTDAERQEVGVRKEFGVFERVE
jgi:hypothetical protein